jgi:hypothetical protein
MIFEMVSSLEMYVICCMTLVGMLIFRLRLTIRFASIAKARWHGCMFDQLHQHDHSKRTFPTDRVVRVSICSTENSDASASAYCAENPGVLALWFDPDEAVVSKFVRPPPFAKVLSFNLTIDFMTMGTLYRGLPCGMRCDSVLLVNGRMWSPALWSAAFSKPADMPRSSRANLN